jgi:uncharacterized protein (TIGR03435 family)
MSPSIRSKCVLAALISSIAAFAQSDPKPAFTVADVHAVAPTANPALVGAIPQINRFELRGATMLDLIRTAWDVDATRVIGGPAWLDTDRFDVIAQTPAGATREATNTMLQSLLAERFSLVVHNDTRDLPAFVMTIAKGGPKLKKSHGADDADCKQSETDGPVNNIYVCHNMTMPSFVQLLPALAPAYFRGTKLVDRTRLDGTWDFTVKWTSFGLVALAGSEGVSLFDFAEKQLGLHIELAKAPIPVVVVDSVNEKPTPNLPGISEKLPERPKEFEAAVIKPSEPGATQSHAKIQNGSVNAQNLTLKNLITMLWDLPEERIAGIPSFADTDRYDIIAKAPAGATEDFDSLRTMGAGTAHGPLQNQNPQRRPADRGPPAGCGKAQTKQGGARQSLLVPQCRLPQRHTLPLRGLPEHHDGATRRLARKQRGRLHKAAPGGGRHGARWRLGFFVCLQQRPHGSTGSRRAQCSGFIRCAYACRSQWRSHPFRRARKAARPQTGNAETPHAGAGHRSHRTKADGQLTMKAQTTAIGVSATALLAIGSLYLADRASFNQLEPEIPRIATVDLYGLRTVPEQAVRDALNLQPGDRTPLFSRAPGLKGAVLKLAEWLPGSKLATIDRNVAIARLERIPGVARADVKTIVNPGGRAALFVGIEENGVRHFTYRPPPSGSVALPAEMTDAYVVHGEALLAAAANPASQLDEDDSQGHALFTDPTMRAMEDKAIQFDQAHLFLARDVLKNSSDANQRAAAAWIVGYAPDKSAGVVGDLIAASRDSDETVRNNATRAIAVIVEFAAQNPELGIHIDPKPFIAMLNSLTWTDRNKATAVLSSLGPEAAAAMRERALPALLEMAQWQDSHYEDALRLLGRIAGLSGDDVDKAIAGGDRGRILATAGVLHGGS